MDLQCAYVNQKFQSDCRTLEIEDGHWITTDSNVSCLCLFLLLEFDNGSSFEQGFLCTTCNQAHFLMKNLVAHLSLIFNSRKILFKLSAKIPESWDRDCVMIKSWIANPESEVVADLILKVWQTLVFFMHFQWRHQLPPWHMPQLGEF
jgi:hypothetical protein